MGESDGDAYSFVSVTSCMQGQYSGHLTAWPWHMCVSDLATRAVKVLMASDGSTGWRGYKIMPESWMFLLISTIYLQKPAAPTGGLGTLRSQRWRSISSPRAVAAGLPSSQTQPVQCLMLELSGLHVPFRMCHGSSKQIFARRAVRSRCLAQPWSLGWQQPSPGLQLQDRIWSRWAWTQP
jgi:hypothetical protein